MKHQYRRLFSLVFIFGAVCFAFYSQAQTVPLEKRNINGVVRDTLNKGISSIKVQLFSTKDTLTTVTSEYGTFSFKDVRSAEFTLKIEGMGYTPFIRRYFNNDTKAQLTLQPIKLGEKSYELEEVTINATRGPQRRGDTTEFWAKDYIVREYSRLEDLLRRLEGVSIDGEGSVFYHGKPVMKALFNGEKYFTGSVKELMKELPADIVERIQIIDTKVESANQDPQDPDKTEKALNVVTLADKSAGKMFDVTSELGGEEHYSFYGAVRTIDASDQKSVKVRYSNEPLGIRKLGPVGSISKGSFNQMAMRSGGTSTGGIGEELTAGTSFSQKAGVITFTHFYDFNFKKSWNNVESVSEEFYSEGNLLRNTVSNQNSTEYSHNWSSNYAIKVKERGHIFGGLALGYKTDENESSQSKKQAGFINNLEEHLNNSESKVPSYRFSASYNEQPSGKHTFNADLNSSFEQDKSNRHESVDVYLPDQALADSSLHLIRKRLNNKFNTNLAIINNFSISDQLKIDLTGTFMHGSGKESLGTERINNLDQYIFLDSLSNQYRYHTLNAPIGSGIEYKLKNLKVKGRLSMVNNWQGLTQESTLFDNVRRFSLDMNPSFSMTYNVGKLSSIDLRYDARSQVPRLEQLNPRRYYIDAFTVNMGNPELKNSVTDGFGASYSSYWPTQKISYSLNGTYSSTRNAIALNRISLIDPDSQTLSTESRYVNVDGNYSSDLAYGLSKSFKNLNTSIKWDGNARWTTSSYFSNNLLQSNRNRSTTNTLAIQMTPASWLDLSPNVNYRTYSSDNSLAFSRAIYNNELTVTMAGRLFLPKEISMDFNLNQKLARGTNLPTNTSPFIINMNIEKRVFKKKNGIVSLVVMDLMQENSFVNTQNYENGYRNTLTNPNSRYFLLQFSWQPQSWTRSKYATDSRKGDGGFL